jgi:hypothetical protein
MKKVVVSIFMLVSLVCAKDTDIHHKHTKMFQSVVTNQAVILQNTKAKKFCPNCGMTLPMFYKTNHAGDLDGHTKQYCSIHCLVEDNLKNHNKIKNIKVVDTNTLKFIDAKNAIYVVGSKKKGTMTMKSKYAFSTMKDAKNFMHKFGGVIMSFDKMYKMVSKHIAKEIKMISKKQAMMTKKGKMIYNKMCKKTNNHFVTTAEAKQFVISNNLCGNLRGKKLQAVGLYLSKR